MLLISPFTQRGWVVGTPFLGCTADFRGQRVPQSLLCSVFTSANAATITVIVTEIGPLEQYIAVFRQRLARNRLSSTRSLYPLVP